MNEHSIYTLSERTVKKYTIGQAVDSAKRRLGTSRICVNAVRARDYKEKITLQELNEIAEEIVQDTSW